jgi:hypothetical protein
MVLAQRHLQALPEDGEAMMAKRTDTERLEFYFYHHLNNGGSRVWEVDSPIGKMWMLSLRWRRDDEWVRLPEEYPTAEAAIDEAMNRSEYIGYGPVEEDSNDSTESR